MTQNAIERGSIYVNRSFIEINKICYGTTVLKTIYENRIKHINTRGMYNLNISIAL